METLEIAKLLAPVIFCSF